MNSRIRRVWACQRDGGNTGDEVEAVVRYLQQPFVGRGDSEARSARLSSAQGAGPLKEIRKAGDDIARIREILRRRTKDRQRIILTGMAEHVPQFLRDGELR